MTRFLYFILPTFFLIGGCLIPLSDGSGIKIGATPIPASEMPADVPPLDEQAVDSALDLGELASSAMDPILGALLYQFVLRPLRRKYGKKDPTPTDGTS